MRNYELNANLRTKKIVFLALIVFLIFLDQISKYIIRHTGGFYICNKGVAFGINMPLWIILIVSLIIFFIFNFQFNMPFLIIFAGGLSNLIDRLVYGCVIDYIDLKFWPASIAMPAVRLSGWQSIAGWPVFNLADVYITAGAILLFWKLLKKPESNQEN